MKFLRKSAEELNDSLNLRYESQSDRNKAREILSRLQKNYCAYSERYLKPLDSVEIEHFDPRKKGTPDDDIRNWHAVVRWMNAHKAKKIELYLPLPEIETWEKDRVRFEHGEFVCDDEDVETCNLLRYLGVNRKEVYDERMNHIERLKRIRTICSDEEFKEILLSSPEDLSFPSAIEAELGIPACDFIDEAVSE